MFAHPDTPRPCDCDMFLDMWGLKSPGVSGLALDLREEADSLLRGLALREGGGAGGGSSKYRYFPVHALSKVPQTRFGELFAAKAGPRARGEPAKEKDVRFSFAELEPYMVGLFGNAAAGQCKTIHELLLKHTKLVDGFYYPKL